jgi:hypothetical protein
MTAVVPDDEVLREIDEDTRRVWVAYREQLRGLCGEEYERTEHEEWTHLQGELRRLERRRAIVNGVH